nr:AbrB/MazE/SpoVT family DNA-binding domain-containing protein [Clostridium paraputrificum]
MKSLGLVRKLDDYKRVHIPKEIKEVLELKEGDSLEFFKSDEGIVIRKYNPSLNEIKKC